MMHTLIHPINQMKHFLFLGCEDILQEELSPSSLLTVLEWSSQPYGSEWVARQVDQYLLEEFPIVAQTETFTRLPKKYLVKILQSDFLQVIHGCYSTVMNKLIKGLKSGVGWVN